MTQSNQLASDWHKWQNEAWREGWDVFHQDDGRLVIQALDDPEEVCLQAELRSIRQFHGPNRDLAAIGWVYRMASSCSPLHVEAVRIIEEHNRQFLDEALSRDRDGTATVYDAETETEYLLQVKTDRNGCCIGFDGQDQSIVVDVSSGKCNVQLVDEYGNIDGEGLQFDLVVEARGPDEVENIRISGRRHMEGIASFLITRAVWFQVHPSGADNYLLKVAEANADLVRDFILRMPFGKDKPH